jgi:hypothetical protein
MSTNSRKKTRIVRTLTAAVLAAYALLAAGCNDQSSIPGVPGPGQEQPR